MINLLVAYRGIVFSVLVAASFANSVRFLPDWGVLLSDSEISPATSCARLLRPFSVRKRSPRALNGLPRAKVARRLDRREPETEEPGMSSTQNRLARVK